MHSLGISIEDNLEQLENALFPIDLMELDKDIVVKLFSSAKLKDPIDVTPSLIIIDVIVSLYENHGVESELLKFAIFPFPEIVSKFVFKIYVKFVPHCPVEVKILLGWELLSFRLAAF